MGNTTLPYQGSFRRYEKKFLLNPTQYHSFLSYLKENASIDQYGLSVIHNIYYDTPNWYLIRRSLEGPAYKEKLRLRTYAQPDDMTTAFIEIKKKFKSIVYKRRRKWNIIFHLYPCISHPRRPDCRNLPTDRKVK